MKLLVAARAMGPDGTSEGICTAKALHLLERLGHDVTCLTNDPRLEAADDTAGLGRGARGLRQVVGVPWTGARVLWFPSHERSGLPLHGRALDKADAALAYSTGFYSVVWQRVAAWRRALARVVAEEQPDLVLVRGAGGCFDPHMACATLPDLRWVAHYHDPWPLSDYPQPYRHRQPIIDGHARRWNRRILRRATAVAFPSRRLAEWQCGHAGVRPAAVEVVPHAGFDDDALAALDLASTPPERAGEHRARDVVWLLHAGSLLTPRNPTQLLEALADHDAAPDRRGPRLGLRQMGSVSQQVLDSERFAAVRVRLERRGLLQLDQTRTSYRQALARQRGADVNLVLERGRPECPFFPAKLADLLSARRPVVALSPLASVTRDLLADHPAVADLDDPGGVRAALRLVADAAARGALDELVPGPAEVATVEPVAVADALDRVVRRYARPAAAAAR
jgi:hypothetical protein